MTGFAVIISFALGAASGWVVRGWKADSAQLAAERAAVKVRGKQDSAVAKQAERYEVVRTILAPVQTETRNTIREIYRDKEIPAVCTVPPAGTRMLDNAISFANAAVAGQLEPAVPAVAEATRALR